MRECFENLEGRLKLFSREWAISLRQRSRMSPEEA
jgi:hypothetical protein